MFENRVPRKIFGRKREEVTRECTKLHSEMLRNLYPSANIITMIRSRKIKLTGHVKVLVGKPEGKTPSRGLRCR
jgi:hypothetical protein